MPADLGPQLFRLLVHQHDAAPIRLDPLEDQFHDPIQQLVDVQRVADRQRRAIHDLEVAAGPGQPGTLQAVGADEDLAAFFLADRLDDARAAVGRIRPDDVHVVRLTGSTMNRQRP